MCTLEHESGLVIAYHNIRSFWKYKSIFEIDAGYSRCDVLILSQTQTLSKDEASPKNFELVFRSDDFSRRQQRGILIFAKKSSRVKTQVITQLIKQNSENQNSYHSDIVVLEINHIYCITGYKSPTVPKNEFHQQLTQSINSIRLRNNSNHVNDVSATKKLF